MWWPGLLACTRDPAVRTRPAPRTDTEAVGPTPATPDCGGVVDTVDRPGPVGASIAATLTLADPGPAHVVCAADDDPEDRVLARSSANSTTHALVIPGLRPDTPFTCDAYADCGGPRHTFVHRVAVPPDVPALRAETAPGEATTGAYTLLNVQRGCFAQAPASLVIVDPEGRLRWSYAVGSGYVCDLDATLIPPDRVHVGGGWGVFDPAQPNRGVFRTVDLAGRVLVERDAPAFGLGFNHHSEPLPDGSVVSLTGTENTADGRTFAGVGIEWWRPDGSLAWTWSSQGVVDAGLVDLPPGEDHPMHANAVRLVDDARGAGAYVSLYGARQIWRIDRDTGERVWAFGRGGDVRVVDERGRDLGDDGFPDVQHDPEYVDGTLLAYDNGQDRGWSRVVAYDLDEDARVATLRWSWTEPGWWDPIAGDADWLPDGRVLVTKAFSREWAPWSSDVSQVVELAPPDHVVWRLSFPDGAWITFRAQRVGGCEVFANAKYCPAVAAELAALHP